MKSKVMFKTTNFIFFKEKITRTGNGKIQIEYLLEGRGDWKPGHRPEYMNKLTRNQASIIFQGRTRMLKVKTNYKKDKRTFFYERICKTKEETQHPILDE